MRQWHIFDVRSRQNLLLVFLGVRDGRIGVRVYHVVLPSDWMEHRLCVGTSRAQKGRVGHRSSAVLSGMRLRRLQPLSRLLYLLLVFVTVSMLLHFCPRIAR